MGRGQEPPTFGSPHSQSSQGSSASHPQPALGPGEAERGARLPFLNMPIPWDSLSSYLLFSALAANPGGCNLGLQGKQGLKESPGLGDLGGHVGIGVLAKGLRGVHAGQHADIFFVRDQAPVLGDVVSVQYRQPGQSQHSVSRLQNLSFHAQPGPQAQCIPICPAMATAHALLPNSQIPFISFQPPSLCAHVCTHMYTHTHTQNHSPWPLVGLYPFTPYSVLPPHR